MQEHDSSEIINKVISSANMGLIRGQTLIFFTKEKLDPIKKEFNKNDEEWERLITRCSYLYLRYSKNVSSYERTDKTKTIETIHPNPAEDSICLLVEPDEHGVLSIYDSKLFYEYEWYISKRREVGFEDCNKRTIPTTIFLFSSYSKSNDNVKSKNTTIVSRGKLFIPDLLKWRRIEVASVRGFAGSFKQLKEYEAKNICIASDESDVYSIMSPFVKEDSDVEESFKRHKDYMSEQSTGSSGNNNSVVIGKNGNISTDIDIELPKINTLPHPSMNLDEIIYSVKTLIQSGSTRVNLLILSRYMIMEMCNKKMKQDEAMSNKLDNFCAQNRTLNVLEEDDIYGLLALVCSICVTPSKQSWVESSNMKWILKNIQVYLTTSVNSVIKSESVLMALCHSGRIKGLQYTSDLGKEITEWLFAYRDGTVYKRNSRDTIWFTAQVRDCLDIVQNWDKVCVRKGVCYMKWYHVKKYYIPMAVSSFFKKIILRLGMDSELLLSLSYRGSIPDLVRASVMAIVDRMRISNPTVIYGNDELGMKVKVMDYLKVFRLAPLCIRNLMNRFEKGEHIKFKDREHFGKLAKDVGIMPSVWENYIQRYSRQDTKEFLGHITRKYKPVHEWSCKYLIEKADTEGQIFECPFAKHDRSTLKSELNEYGGTSVKDIEEILSESNPINACITHMNSIRSEKEMVALAKGSTTEREPLNADSFRRATFVKWRLKRAVRHIEYEEDETK